MVKRIILISFVVIVGVGLGVSFVVRSQENSASIQILEQQRKMFAAQEKLSRHLGVDKGQPTEKNSPEISRQQKALEQRILKLEDRINVLERNTRLTKGAEAKPTQFPSEEDAKVYDIKVNHSLVKGEEKALVTVVEFLDFQCPFSARFHPILAEALKAYPKEVKYMLKNFPLSFHPQAKPAAKAALAAGEQGKYWEMVEVLLKNNQNLNEETFKKLAKELGLNVRKFSKDYTEKDAKWEDLFKEDISLAREIDVRGTPTFFINGRKTNARDAESFKKEITKALEEAKIK